MPFNDMKELPTVCSPEFSDDDMSDNDIETEEILPVPQNFEQVNELDRNLETGGNAQWHR